MNIKFKHLKLNNFCGLHDLDTDLYDRTIVKGRNKSGKTTIKNSIYWNLFNKLSDGSAPDGIRPHDEDGKDIDMTDIAVTVTMDIDGKEVRATKTQKQNWVKDRTTQEQKFKGNVNEFDINGIPKKEKDFVDYMNQFIDLDNFMFCTNPNVFLRMDNKKRRATLFSLVGEAVDEEIINANPQFERLRSDLMDGTVEELITRSKHAVSSLKEDLKTIPARIDEVNLHIEEMSEDEIKATKAKLADAESKLEECSKVAETYENLKRKIHEDGLKIQKIIADVEIANQQARAKSGMEEQALTQQIALLRGAIPQIESRIKEANNRIADHKSMIPVYINAIKEIKEETFNENQKCPVCGSKYTKAKADALRQIWQDSQDKKCEDNAHLSTECEARIVEIESQIAEWESEITAKQAEIEEKEKMLALVDKTEFVPLKAEDTKEYKEITKDIENLKHLQENITLSSGEEKQAILSEITNCKTALNKIQTNEAYKQRIEELTQEQLQTSQKIANEEQMLDLLQEYQRTKVGLLTDEINKYFHVIKWQFFKEQINGGFAEVCIPLVNGTSYDGLLNHGDKLLAEIDLCMAFQRKAGITAPIIIDDTESLDADRIPQIDSQLICIRRTDDTSLTIESLS